VKDLAQGVAGDVLGAAKDGAAKVSIVKMLILSIVFFLRWNPRPTHACRPHACP